MNIRVDLTTPIRDGMEVVFRSPVDCSQVTGLKLYYLGESKEFAFADAHGNNVGDIDHLFAENVVVKVILDVTAGMAFVQNADTNAYLEGRFDDIFDKLCPSIDKSGTLVQCEPLEGSALTISTESLAGNGMLTICGKNLYNGDSVTGYPLAKDVYINMKAGSANEPSSGSENKYAATAVKVGVPLYIPCNHLAGSVIMLNNPALGGSPGMAFYDANKKYISGGKGDPITVPTNAAFMSFTINAAVDIDTQIEIGSKSTDYEAYWEKKQSVAGEDIPVNVEAGKGVNTVYLTEEGSGNAYKISVNGKSDPVAMLKNLTSEVERLSKAIASTANEEG